MGRSSPSCTITATSRICSTASISSPRRPTRFSLNFGFTRSWFQTPNSYDAQDATAWSGPVCELFRLFDGMQRPRPQRPGGRSHGPAFANQNLQHRPHLDAGFSIAQHRVHLRRLRAAGSIQLLSERRSVCRPHPGSSTPDHRPESPADRSRGFAANVSYVKGIHNIKVGVTYSDTILTENDTFGIVDPTANAVCLNRRRKSRPESAADQSAGVHRGLAAESELQSAARPAMT